MATPKRKAFHEMDHDHELLREEIVFASRTDQRGPIPEFLAKKRAEQGRDPDSGIVHSPMVPVLVVLGLGAGAHTVGVLACAQLLEPLPVRRPRGVM